MWINKFMYFYELQFHGEKILFSNLFSLPMKSDLPFGRNWGLQHLAKCGENGVEFRVVSLLHLSDFSAQILMSGEHGTKLEKGTHDGDVYLDGAITMENAGEHGYAMLGEGIRAITTASVNGQT